MLVKKSPAGKVKPLSGSAEFIKTTKRGVWPQMVLSITIHPHRPTPHPMPYHHMKTHTHTVRGEGCVATDGECVDGCVMLH